MGQQQLLLIVLGVIIVGIAVVVGINMFRASSANANQEALVSDLTNLASMAQQHYRKPAALGGGNRTFDGSSGGGAVAWTVPTTLQRTNNMSVNVAATVAAQTVTLVAVGTEDGDGDGTNCTVTMIVGPNAITSTAITNP